MAWLRATWRDFTDNLDNYLTITVAILLAVLSCFDIAEEKVVFSAILAVLALVSYSLLKDRRQNIRYRLFKKRFDVEEELALVKQGRKVILMGPGFTVLIPRLVDHFAGGLPPNVEMKVLVTDPDGNAIKLAAFRAHKPVGELRDVYVYAFSRLWDISEKSTGGKLEIRVLDYLAPYAMIGIDPNSRTGALQMRLTAWHAPRTEDRPLIELSRSQDGEWFEHFIGDFEKMWEEATPWKPPAKTLTPPARSERKDS
jgi:hypothetical protein